MNLPHDWSIEGPYAATNASGTGFLPGGVGWYRKTFQLPAAQRGHRVFIDFDGVYRDSDVWINGHHLGHRPYGYSSFEYDLTPNLNFGDAANVIAVRVDHGKSADSRWYTGSGIYRHVWLVSTEAVHIAHWGTYVYTPVVEPSQARVTVETVAANDSSQDAVVRLVTSLEDLPARKSFRRPRKGAPLPGPPRPFCKRKSSRIRSCGLQQPLLYSAVSRVYRTGNCPTNIARRSVSEAFASIPTTAFF